MRDQYGIYYSENKTNQFLGSTLKVSNDVIMVSDFENYNYRAEMLSDENRFFFN